MKKNGVSKNILGHSPPSLLTGIILLSLFLFFIISYGFTIQNLNYHTQNTESLMAVRSTNSVKEMIPGEPLHQGIFSYLADLRSRESQQLHLWTRFLLGAMGVIGILGVLWLWEDRIRKQQQRLLQESYQQSLFTIDAERGNLARELHDTVAQELAALKIVLYQIPVQPKMKERVHGILDRAQGQLRQIALGLRPPLLDTLGLLEALKYLSDTFTLKSGIQVSLVFSAGDSHILKGDRAMNLYRVVQEALMNAWKHSHALKVAIHGRIESETLFLEITDDGKGMDKGTWDSLEPSSTFGLAGMKERIQLLGGSFTITSIKGSGTVIRLEVPV